MPLSKLREFLDQNNIKYLMIFHPASYTPQGLAEKMQVSGNALAKTVIVQIDGRLAMAVIPAPAWVDLAILRQSQGAKVVERASESAFRRRVSNCEFGAMPPFGNLYGMGVFADESLERQREITFGAGTGQQLLRMNYADFRDLVKPVILPLASAKAAACAVGVRRNLAVLPPVEQTGLQGKRFS